MDRQRLIIVSNRLPFQFSERKGKIAVQPSSGGLVSSIQSYIHHLNLNDEGITPVWIGDPGISEKKFTDFYGKLNIQQDEFMLHPVFLTESVREKYYNGFCNDTIWPLFHYFPSYAKFTEDSYEYYQIANQLFSNKITEVYQPGDLIWIHDYHLMLVPNMLRSDIPNAAIGFFLHIPFPSFELFRLLPNRWRTEILNGLLGADLIGFHTNNYVQYFLKSVQQILGYDHNLRLITTPDRSVTVDTFPVSIDYHKFHQTANNLNVFAERNRIKKKLSSVKIIISVDRLDYTKGIISRLEAFELFLEKYPEQRGKVVYVPVVVPSRDIIARYKEIKNECEILISRINGKYGGFEWTPILYQYKSLDFEKLTALYLAADVALITPLRDGMNLVAKEFIAARNDRKGVLILSETAGAAAELSEALLVNPTDRKEIAETLFAALSMSPEEQIRRNTSMQSRLKLYDVVKWADDFITQVMLSKEKQKTLQIKEVNDKIEEEILEDYCNASKRIIFLDYDGTLSPITQLPQQAVPSDDLRRLLELLANDKKNTIVLISGRPKKILEEWFGHLSIVLVAEHGAFYRSANNDWSQTISANVDWKEKLLPLLELFVNRCAGALVENKTLSLSWHYRNADKELGFLRSRELINSLNELSAHLDFQLIDGNKVIEIKAHGVDKGMAARLLLNSGSYDFILAIGDDKTDEDLFGVLPIDAFSIRVGLTQSIAKYNFRKQGNVIVLLNKIITCEKHVV